MLVIITTDEDPSLRFESFAMINLRGVSKKAKLVSFKLHQNMYLNTVYPIIYTL